MDGPGFVFGIFRRLIKRLCPVVVVFQLIVFQFKLFFLKFWFNLVVDFQFLFIQFILFELIFFKLFILGLGWNDDDYEYDYR